MYEKILMAFDGSETSLQALDEALRLAQLAHAKLYVAHVIDVIAPLGMGLTYVPADLVDAYREEAKRLLDVACARATAAGVACETLLLEVEGVTDSVASCLIRCAVRVDAQLAVLGTYGRRGVSRAFLGSVAEAFVREADCPVLLVRGLY